MQTASTQPVSQAGKKPKFPSTPEEFNRKNLLRIAGELGITSAHRKWQREPTTAERENIFIREVINHFMARSRVRTYKLLFLSNGRGLIGGNIMFPPKERLEFLRSLARRAKIQIPTLSERVTEHDVAVLEKQLFNKSEVTEREHFLRALARERKVRLKRGLLPEELELRMKPHLDRRGSNQLAFDFKPKTIKVKAKGRIRR
ncbi:Uncharacterised protein [uncultured archaeon]|nr:Uncharacterised protein [uncultured archaeon]